MGHTSTAGAPVDFKKRATAASLALHGVVVALLGALATKHPSPSVPHVVLTPVEIAAEPPPAPPTHKSPSVVPAGAPTGASVHGRREAVQRAQPAAPQHVQSLADLQVHYDEETTRFADHDRARLADVTSDVGLTGIGAALGVPDAPTTASHARGPRAKHDYSNLRIVGASEFAGHTIRLRLSIDTHGRVRAVQVLQGVSHEIDRKTVALVREFEYEPALGDDGAPIAGSQRWDFQVVADDDEDQ